MRRIERRPKAPEPLVDPRAREARRAVAEFFALDEKEREARRPPIDEKIVHNDVVRSVLHEVFSGKCAYCESRSGGQLDIERHRPVSNVGGARKRQPHHYAWLAYEWENLLLVCQACNSRKRNLFPLRGPRAPLMAPLSRVRAVEAPKLLDPGVDRPELHLDFSSDGRCWPRTTRGAFTISTLELNREALVEERRNAFANLVRPIGPNLLDPITAAVLKQLDNDDATPFLGSLRILRYRLLSKLASRSGHFEFSYDDTPDLIDSVLEQASRDDLFSSLDALEVSEVRPEKSVTPIAERKARPFTPPIRRIEIQNFKAIDHMVIEMQAGRSESGTAAALMLLGENATGKSSVLEAVTLALAGARTANDLAKAREYRPNAEYGGHPGPYGPTWVRVEFAEGPPAELSIENDLFVGTSEPRANVLAYGSRRYFMPGRRRRSKTGGLRGLFDPSWMLPHPDLWLGGLSTDRFPDVAQALAEVLALPPAGRAGGGAYLSQNDDLGVCLVEAGRITPLARHSDGYRSIFATAVDILRGLVGATDLLNVDAVVLIDEVETHLHPRWKMRLMAGLRRALPNVQFIVTTHDPLCLRGMGQGEVQVMARGADDHIRLVPDLPDVSGMRIDQILTSEHFGMFSTLDPDFQELFDRYYALLRDGQGTDAHDAELNHLRATINSRQRLGQTTRERLLLEAIDRNLARRVEQQPFHGADLGEELDAIWAEAAGEIA